MYFVFFGFGIGGISLIHRNRNHAGARLYHLVWLVVNQDDVCSRPGFLSSASRDAIRVFSAEVSSSRLLNGSRPQLRSDHKPGDCCINRVLVAVVALVRLVRRPVHEKSLRLVLIHSAGVFGYGDAKIVEVCSGVAEDLKG